MPGPVAMLYGALAVMALASVWHNRSMRPLGWALVAAWVMSNIIHIYMAFEWRPVLYPVIDLMIAIVARIVWTRTGYKVAVAATVLSLANSLINVAYTLVLLKHGDVPPAALKDAHTLATNIIFGGKCLMILIWGVADARGWFDYFSGLYRRDRGVAEPARSEAAQKGQAE